MKMTFVEVWLAEQAENAMALGYLPGHIDFARCLDGQDMSVLVDTWDEPGVPGAQISVAMVDTREGYLRMRSVVEVPES